MHGPVSPRGLGTPMLTHSSTPMHHAGKLQQHDCASSPPRGGAVYTSPLRSSQTSIGGFKAAPTAKLEHVAERFSGFYSDLQQEQQQRKLQESARYQNLQEAIGKLEKSVESEVKRRAEADRQLQAHFDAEVKGLQERLSSNYAELSGAFKSSLEGLARTVQDLHSIIKDEREQRRADIEHLAASLVGKVNECVAAIDEERNGRLETENKTVRQVGADLLRLQERLEGEKAAREADVNQLRGEVHEVLGSRNVSDERFQAVVLDEIAGLKNALSTEREERICEDDEIVAAVNDYTRALQDGLKMLC